MVDIYGYSIATIPVVCAIVYVINELIKYLFGSKVETFKRYIPIFSCVLGAVIGVIIFAISPELVPVSSWYSALLVGGASGLSAVGINQISKQLSKQGGERDGS